MSPSAVSRFLIDWYARAGWWQRQSLGWGVGICLVSLLWLGASLLYIAHAPDRVRSRQEMLRSILVLKASLPVGFVLALAPPLLAFGVLGPDRIMTQGGFAAFALTLLWWTNLATALFMRADPPEQGLVVTAQTHPRLHALVVEAIEKVGIAPFEEILLIPDASFAVASRRRRHATSLHLGFESLRHGTTAELKSTLVHECAHVLHGDEVFRGQVSSTLNRMNRMRSAPYNDASPFCGFVRRYLRFLNSRVFAHFRQNELDADELEAHTYGAATFERALEVFANSYRVFDLATDIATGLRKWGHRASVYDIADDVRRLEPNELRTKRERDRRSHQAVDPLDSHPSHAERLEATKDRDSRPFEMGPVALTVLDEPERCRQQLDSIALDEIDRHLNRRRQRCEPSVKASPESERALAEAVVLTRLGHQLVELDATAGDQMISRGVADIERLLSPTDPYLAGFLVLLAMRRIKSGAREVAQGLLERATRLILFMDPSRRTEFRRGIAAVGAASRAVPQPSSTPAICP